MSGYQFGHVTTFSMKGNTKTRSAISVLGENSREPGQANHVENAMPPEILFGCDPIKIVPILEEKIAEAKLALKGTGMRMQSNTHILEGSVFSYPSSVEDLQNDPSLKKSYQAWRKDMMDYVISDAKRRGMETLSIVEHTDESYPHIHVLSIPNITTENPRMDAKACHAGHKAAKLAAQNGENPRAQMKAYRTAMSEWQDDLWSNVSAKHGLTRVGPRLKRFTRTEWAEQKKLAQSVKKVYEFKEKIEKECTGTIQELEANKALINKTKEIIEKNNMLKREVSRLKTALNEAGKRYESMKEELSSEYAKSKESFLKTITELQETIKSLKPKRDDDYTPRM